VRHETSFDPESELIIVNAMVSGPRGRIPARLALDTGSSVTLIVPDLLDEIGYSARDGVARTSVTTAIGAEHGYLLKVAQLDALGFTRTAFPVHVFDLANRHGIHGLIGLNFLRNFNYEIRPEEGRIVVDEIASRRQPR
jgi:predicted aspartyl protease